MKAFEKRSLHQNTKCQERVVAGGSGDRLSAEDPPGRGPCEQEPPDPLL